MWKQTVASLSTTCMKSDPDWFHPVSCPVSPETTLVFWENYFFFFGFTRSTAQDFSICSNQKLLCNSSTFVFNPVLLLSRSQALGHSGSVVVFHQLSCREAFAIIPNQVSNAYLQLWIKRQNTLGEIWNASLLHESWHHGLFMRRLIEDCPRLQATSWDQDWFCPPKCSYSILTVLPCGFVLAWVSETHTRPQLPEGRAVTWLTFKYMSVDLVSLKLSCQDKTDTKISYSILSVRLQVHLL